MWKMTSSSRSLELEVSLEGLRESISSLKAAKDEVSTRVWISEVGGMVPTSEVRTWLRDARVAEQAARDLLTECELMTSLHHHRKSSLIIGCFAAPRYSLSNHRLQQKIARTRAKVDQLIEARQTFDAPLGMGMGMGCSSPSPVDDEDPTVGLESVFEQVWASLMVMDEERRRCGITIGLWGMGGIGKTTLLRKIKNALDSRSYDFDMVIWVSVAKTSTEEEIQDYILRRLQLHQQQQPQDHYRSSSSVPVPNKIPRGEKAARINAFMKGKRCVLLLDDVWERIDLRKVGIPFPEDDDDDIDSTAPAAVIFTTRSRNLCDSMDADRVFEIGVLSQEQAWRLFTMKVGGDAALNPDTIDLARQVMEECGGNPLALVTMGHSMANKNTPQEWRLALHKLRSPAYDDDDDAFGKSVYYVVKRSYESLSTDAARECFIHCSLFTKGSPIDKNQLLDYWIGEGFLNELSDDERDARSVGFSVLGELVSASLLQLDDIGSSVKMHDLIHDVALWIASDCGKNKDNFFVQAGVNLAEVPKFLNWRVAKRVSLMDNCIEELDNFTEESDDPLPLLTLFLSKNRFAFISNNFFANMPSLRTLDLSWSKLAELPQTICGLIALQYLNLSHTYISELPKSIEKLVSLKVFDLSYTSALYRFPTRVLSSLSSLQTLNMLYCGHSNLNEEGPDLYIDTVDFLEELESLPLLNDLSLNIKGKFAFDKLRSSKKLPGCTRSLSIVQCKGLTSIPLSSIQFMTCLDTIEVRNCQDLEEFEIDCFVREKKISRRFMSKVYFKCLQHVTIRDCWSLKNLTWLSFTPNLESLRVERCMKLEEIISGHVSADWDVEEASRTFLRLKCLYLGYLPELRLISDIALEFPALEEITVVFCAELKRLPVDRKIGLRSLKMIKGHINWWDGLQWEVEEEEDKSNNFSRYFTDIEV